MVDLNSLSESELDAFIAETEAVVGEPAAPSPLDTLSEPELDAFIAETEQVTKPLTGLESMVGGLTKIGQGLTFGGFDEFASGMAAVPALFTSADAGEVYNDYLGRFRGIEERYDAQNPVASTILEIGGGSGAIKKAGAHVLKKAPGLVGRTVKGVGTGVAGGSTYGFLSGEGGVENRTAGAAQGGVFGGAVGGGLGLGIGVAAKGLGSMKAAKFRQTLKESVENFNVDERGAVGNLGKRVSPDEITAGKRLMLQIIDEADAEDINLAKKRIRIAEKNKQPITIMEALDIDEAYATGKAIRASKGGATPAGRFLNERGKNQTDRMTEVLDEISPEEDAYILGNRYKAGVEGVEQSMKAERRLATKGLFDEAAERAGNTEMKSDGIAKVVNHPLSEPMLKQTRKLYASDIPDGATNYHYEVLKNLKESLAEEAGNLRANARPKAAMKYEELAETLVEEMDTFTDYKKPLAEYAKHSRKIEEVIGGKFAGKRTVGILEDVLSANSQNAGAATKNLLKKSPRQIEKIVKVFKEYGDIEDLRAAVRGNLQHKVDEFASSLLEEAGGDLSLKLKLNQKAQRNLEQILGKRQASKTIERLKVEALIGKGGREFGKTIKGMGSNTQTQQDRTGGILAAIKRGVFNKKDAAEAVFDSLLPSENEELMKQISEEIFQPANMKEFDKLVRFKRLFDQHRIQVEAGARRAQKAGTVGAVQNRPGGLSDEAGKFKPGAAAGTAAAGGAAAYSLSGSESGSLPDDGKKNIGETPQMDENTLYSSIGTALQEAGIEDPTEQAQFLAQLSHESDGFKTLEEYATGEDYEGSKVLGNTEPGDGKRFKGRGFIQLTGRWNYKHYGDKIGVDLIKNPELAADPDIAAKIAAQYWKDRVRPKVQDFSDTKAVTKAINGGYNGLEDRMEKFKEFQSKFS